MRQLHRVLLVLLVALPTACIMWQPGKDPRGRALIAEANVVLDAANRFTREHGTTPSSLQELVPGYISKLPPWLNYDPKRASLGFNYSPTLAVGRCICTAKVGATAFNCGACY